MSSRPSDIPDEEEPPQEITCTGGVRVNFGALFGGKPEAEKEGQESGE